MLALKVILKERTTEVSGKIPYLTLKTSDLEDISRNRKCRSLSYSHVVANLRSIQGLSEELWPFSHQCADQRKSFTIDCKVQSIVNTIDCNFFSQKSPKSLLEPYKYPVSIQKTGSFSITRNISVFQ